MLAANGYGVVSNCSRSGTISPDRPCHSRTARMAAAMLSSTLVCESRPAELVELLDEPVAVVEPSGHRVPRKLEPVEDHLTERDPELLAAARASAIAGHISSCARAR